MTIGKVRKSAVYIVLSLLLLPGHSANSTELNLIADAPLRTVEGNIIVSKSEPSLAINIDPTFRYLGEHPIRIRDVAAGERMVFADLDGSLARRLLIIQFEGFLSGIDDEYRYNLSRSPVVAGYPFRSNAYAFDFAKSAADNPGLESAATARFLDTQSITALQQLAMWRSLTVASRDKRNEMIIFYLEDLSLLNMTLEEIYDPVTGEETPAWQALQPALEKRANAAFSLAELGEGGRPLTGQWHSIPLSLSR